MTINNIQNDGLCLFLVFHHINQSSISLIANLRPESRIANDMQLEIIDKTANETNNVHIMYIGARRDVWSELGVTMLVGNGVDQSL